MNRSSRISTRTNRRAARESAMKRHPRRWSKSFCRKNARFPQNRTVRSDQPALWTRIARRRRLRILAAVVSGVARENSSPSAARAVTAARTFRPGAGAIVRYEASAPRSARISAQRRAAPWPPWFDFISAVRQMNHARRAARRFPRGTRKGRERVPVDREKSVNAPPAGVHGDGATRSTPRRTATPRRRAALARAAGGRKRAGHEIPCPRFIFRTTAAEEQAADRRAPTVPRSRDIGARIATRLRHTLRHGDEDEKRARPRSARSALAKRTTGGQNGGGAPRHRESGGTEREPYDQTSAIAPWRERNPSQRLRRKKEQPERHAAGTPGGRGEGRARHEGRSSARRAISRRSCLRADETVVALRNFQESRPGRELPDASQPRQIVRTCSKGRSRRALRI